MTSYRFIATSHKIFISSTIFPYIIIKNSIVSIDVTHHIGSSFNLPQNRVRFNSFGGKRARPRYEFRTLYHAKRSLRTTPTPQVPPITLVVASTSTLRNKRLSSRSFQANLSLTLTNIKGLDPKIY